MPRVKQASKSKRVTKAAVPALGAAGLSLAMVGGASASAVPTDVQQTNNFSPTQSITLGEEEIADVSLATFYLFDKENPGTLRGMVHQARGCGCGGGRGCGGRGCRGCGGRGCGGRGCGCGGCVGCAGCCLSWGYCRLC